ncbi:MAG: EVE domain-containing protein, partial [Chitinophagaceae bacterium]
MCWQVVGSSLILRKGTTSSIILLPTQNQKIISMAYWLVKSEPSSYSWDQFVKEGKTFWNGVRNYAAR